MTQSEGLLAPKYIFYKAGPSSTFNLVATRKSGSIDIVWGPVQTDLT